jgi:hypothetical protein
VSSHSAFRNTLADAGRTANDLDCNFTEFLCSSFGTKAWHSSSGACSFFPPDDGWYTQAARVDPSRAVGQSAPEPDPSFTPGFQRACNQRRRWNSAFYLHA